MPTDIRRHQIAAGHNNQLNLKFFHKLDDCLFQRYRTYIPFEWHNSESVELGADKRYVLIGLPWYELLFPYITEEEYKYLVTTFASNKKDGLVTFVGYDRSETVWKTFNGTLVLPEDLEYDQEYGFYRDFRLEIRYLQVI